MNPSALVKLGIGVLLIAASAPAHAAAFEDMPADLPVLPHESTQRFLNGVRVYGDGRPSPNILYSTAGIGESLNSPAARKGPSVVSTGTPAPHKALGGSTLSKGKSR